LISSIAYSADSSAYYFSYEPTPGYSGDVTGRLASVTLRTGGTISYAYTGANNGIQPDGTLSGLTRTTSDGSIAYSRSGITSTSSTTQRLDADSNATVSQFQISGGYFFETDQATYTGPASGTPLMEAQTCFNEYSSVGCTITSGVVESVNTAYLANGTTYDNTSSQYNSVGLMTAATNQHGTLEYSYTTLTNASGGAMYRLSGVSMNGTTMFTYGYDETTPIATSGLPSHGTVTGSRGNQTSAHAWYSSSAHLDATTTYDDAGQVLAQTDWNGNTTSYQYDSATDALLTQTTLPNGLYSTTVFDPNTGLQTSGTDLTHTNTTTYSYDGLLRPLTVAAPDGGTTTYSYASPTQTQVSVLRGGTSYNVQTSVVDGYGRTSTITQTDAESGNETATTTYDESGRVHSVTNPHRSSSSSTDGTTTYAYDAAGRAVTVTEPDTSQVTYNYTAAAGYVTVTDEQGNQRKLGYESAGAANGTVYEPDASGAMTLLTQSTLDATGHVTAVSQQGGATSSSQYRNRSFVYDSAERLTSETTPEQGTITYTYVNGGGGLCSGNLTAPCARTDARGVTATYSYDTLGRLTGKTYSDATPTISYSYDQSGAYGLTIANGAGERTSMADGTGTSAWSYDTMGRVVAEKRTIGGVTKSAGYSYNVDGTMATLTDYAGNTLDYGYGSRSQLLSVTDAGTGLGLVSAVTYTPVGTMTGGRLGNGAVMANSYNPRVQPVSLGAAVSGTAVFGLGFSYGTSGHDNGNIMGVTNALNGARSQSFGYDQLNRISTAQAGSLWGNSYAYDNWGNLLTKTPLSGLTGESVSMSAGVTNQVSVGSAAYDAAGNMTTDNTGETYNYDAEGRISATGGYNYYYNGDGVRVAKVDGSAGRIYWPDESGESLNETDLSGGTVARNVYWGGTQIARQDSGGNWTYLLHDQLGSTRMALNASGGVVYDVDYYPFGTVAYSSGSSTNLYGFTGYETDAESGTDYAVFRNHSTALGRFMRPDPYDGSYDITNPQSLNRYAYVINNPLAYVDPGGLYCEYGNNGDGQLDDTDYYSTEAECTSNNGQWFPDGAATYGGIDSFGGVGSGSGIGDVGGGTGGTSTGAPSKPNCPANGGGIANVSVTTAAPTTAVGAFIGSLFGPEGTAIGAAIGSSFGIGASVSYVPSSNSWYVGWTAVASPLNGGGISASYSFVPKGQNPNSIANGTSYSVSSTTPFGPILTKSPGSGPAVPGIAVGTHTPIAVSAGHSWCVHNCGC
jgi:RHS repeat-associated protein